MRKCQDEIWGKLYLAAQEVLRPRKISSAVDAGGVAAAIETDNGNIYTGVCVDTACSLGVCAERNAIFNMITNGESSIRRVIAIGSDGKAMPPCGACREFIAQLMPETFSSVDVMLDYENRKTVTLSELLPDWWL